jgi:hypothetical protein
VTAAVASRLPTARHDRASSLFRPHTDGEPIATLTADEIDPITDALRALIGRQ